MKPAGFHQVAQKAPQRYSSRLVDEKARQVCERKRRHPDEPTARAAAASHLARNDNAGGELHTYRCLACHGWHLTRFKVGASVRAENTVIEPDWRTELLAIVAGGKVQSYRNCQYGARPKQEWLHEACLILEREGKLRRYFEREHSITWVLA